MVSRVALILTHVAGNALLLALGYWWLGTGESDSVHLLLSAMTVLVLLAGATWLHGLALAYFCGLSYGAAAARALRHLLPLLSLVALGFALYALLRWITLHDAHTAYVVGSYATLKTRKPVAPTTVARVFQAASALVRWLVLPAILYPLAAAIAMHGWSGWRFTYLRRMARTWLYWIQVPGLLLCAWFLPWHLFFWIPRIESFPGQLISLSLRLGFGYLIAVTALLALAFFTSSGSPCASQSNTAPSP